MNVLEFSYKRAEIVLDQRLASEISEVLVGTCVTLLNKSSKDLRISIEDKLNVLGWSDKVSLQENSNITITSINQEHGLCVQTGNFSRFYADILKLEYLYKKDKIRGAFYIILSKDAAKAMNLSNVVTFERLKRELQIFSDIITVPIKVYGLNI
ncbi:hypothetical protein [Sabulibacter ruber]|uniref:hypothetical protein n=1 Tax=Sabulibacter ruber TaxID=2811901 RepID=UPI001A97A060|nr:hypothetical protein [Sabulibacter ruber]